MPLGDSTHSMVGMSPKTGTNWTPNNRVCRKVMWIGSISFSRTCNQLQGEWRLIGSRRAPGRSNRS